ncbi:PD-(D/E)XK motif protein [Mesorhizobium sp. B292B1B]|uniref:PD-(D/E)XK motif protein n=1 Tax=unclassified Mesorhizobium TaxID=325217 RepID=UPI00112A9083|nr:MULTISPECIES: PD-(D/E)XK motif protein [unclassified Mesorhizobium]MCA0015563.1 PD-(D/E)XK motif protein [Mesorhizobium sp. B294B1A1]MCA0041371.1 PD-(D/E)XK motif protein [Mesorhizobium sp. B292B1B]TPM48139.1 PD-(D/E)XK motif protein [Mesorhizobium sp. B2-3-2]
MMDFETLRDQLSTLEVPAGNARRLIWVVNQRLGAAMTNSGAYEIFLAGPELSAVQPLVARHLQYDRWEPSDGAPAFAATRVLLGSATHFAAVATLIVTELARLDLSTDPAMQAAFNEVEPIIELAIRRGTLSTETLLGLVAELQVLRVALLATPMAKRPTVLLGWRGWTQGRDFVMGRHALEIKATLGDTSRHAFSGVHQLEAQPLPDGSQEMLHLMSFGLAEVDKGGQDLPELVDDIASLLDDGSTQGGGARAQFFGMIREYGGPGAPGYDHDTMRSWSVYQARHVITFTRLYSVDDPEMRLLTSALIGQTFVVPGSVNFELQLPTRVSTFNPAANWQTEVASMLA